MRGIFFISFLFSVCFSIGQNNPSLTISPKKIKIGEQAKLTLTYSYSGDYIKTGEWPTFSDTIIDKVEIIETGKLEKEEIKSGKKGLSQTWIITSFDSGYYAIPPMQIIHKKDTLFSNPVLLDVKSVDVDTTRAFKKIKGIYETKLSWSDYFKMIGDWIKDNIILLLAILVVIGGIIYYLWWKKRKKPEVAAPIIIIPPHQIALEELEKLRHKRLWQEGNIKLYYIELTDILRNYIEKRFLIHAMEQTTEEIMSQLRLTDISEISKLTLVPVLKLSDLVKFAKENPMGMENDEMLQRAIDFVTSTIPIQKPMKEKNN